MTLRASSLVLAGIVASLVGASAAASEQTYPNQVVRIVVPFSAGSITDGLARHGMVVQEIKGVARAPDGSRSLMDDTTVTYIGWALRTR